MTTRTLQVSIAVAVALAVVALFFVFANPFSMTSSSNSTNPLDSTLSAGAPASDTSAPQGLVVQDESVGTGATAAAGDTVIVNYTGKLQDGTVFDTSVGKPAASTCPPGTTQGFCFVLGAGQVIPGWDQGLQGMKVGGKRLLVIPANLAYGNQQVGPIPANSTLIFEVDLLSVSPATSVGQ